MTRLMELDWRSIAVYATGTAVMLAVAVSALYAISLVYP